ncbi:hypothetical protein [Psychrobium sp. 1_MG-2023]|uniref:hypothetical protein n=1 Tax=Psychrobium sp. 1_MG-2023 TaxID=3062624 RepID=UPI000C325BED|nr:hypothetical protein [Psychrobium sp. 1_MG-2023]MDP2562674.1 hypothetical protein [Psychrobium sp. 1_MG-2023]PKF54812.1 hypothetical protein CW748_15430 [Alteromonadales bacterium alter-6D02]
MKSKLLLITLFAALSLPVKANFIESTDCVSNCVKVELIGESVVVKQVNNLGNVIGIDVVKLGAEPISVSRQNSDNIEMQYTQTVNAFTQDRLQHFSSSSSFSDQEGSFNVSTERYETPTEIIIIHITIFRNSDGDIIDVQTREVRFAKPDPETGGQLH